mmetsp:Transcript_21246/g.32914  ORF Transcript_21246/g.32914 Transcript_21246/m.32914 type:complete len:90 (+) Transcript_21246:540-809(+)
MQQSSPHKMKRSPEFSSSKPDNSLSFNTGRLLCALNIELDGGANVEEIRVYEGEDPAVIVRKFGQEFNLSERAMQTLLGRIRASMPYGL